MQAGVHSGDSACVIPTQGISAEALATIREWTPKLAKDLRVIGLINIQYCVQDDQARYGTLLRLNEHHPRQASSPFAKTHTSPEMCHCNSILVWPCVTTQCIWHRLAMLYELIMITSMLPGVHY